MQFAMRHYWESSLLLQWEDLACLILAVRAIEKKETIIPPEEELQIEELARLAKNKQQPHFNLKNFTTLFFITRPWLKTHYKFAAQALRKSESDRCMKIIQKWLPDFDRAANYTNEIEKLIA